jgi:hypothetical protein
MMLAQLAPDYLNALATQIGSVSAFLGGFAATFLVLFLTFSERSRAASVAVGGSALASVGFIVAVIATTLLVAATHPHAPPDADTSVAFGRSVMGLSFLIAMIALLVSVGASGWIRSRALGWTTTTFAAIAILLGPALLR